MPTYGNQGNCSSEVIEVGIILNSKISSNMANYSALVTVVGSCYAFRIKCMCNETFGTSHILLTCESFFYSFNPSMYYSIAITVMEKFHVDIHPRKKEVRI